MPDVERASPSRGRIVSLFRRFRDWGGKEFDRAALIYVACFLAGLGYGRLDIRDPAQAASALRAVPDIGHRPDPAARSAGDDSEVDGTSDARAVAAFAVSLFLHNLRAAAITMALGVLAGLLAYLPMAGNGAVLGYWCAGWFFTAGGEAFRVMALLIPHGIFELTAFFAAAAAGARIDRAAAGRGFGGRVGTFFGSWPAFLGVAALLALAAGIESKVAFAAAAGP